MKTVLGIDPGVNGALALYDPIFQTLDAWPMPTLKTKVGKTFKAQIDMWALTTLITAISDAPVVCFLEDVAAMPGQGVTSMFSMGRTLGRIEMAIVSAGLSLEMITPRVWKKFLRCPADKDGARLRASQIFPKYANLWPRKKDDGVAEAALIAYYGSLKSPEAKL